MTRVRYTLPFRNRRMNATREGFAAGRLMILASDDTPLLSFPLSVEAGSVADGVWTLGFASSVASSMAAGVAAKAIIQAADGSAGTEPLSVGLSTDTPLPAVILSDVSLVSGMSVQVTQASISHGYVFVVAPAVLSDAAGSSSGSDGFIGSVRTSKAGGEVFVVLVPEADPLPDAEQVIRGENAAGQALPSAQRFSVPAGSAGVIGVSRAGLTAGIALRPVYAQLDADSIVSNVAAPASGFIIGGTGPQFYEDGQFTGQPMVGSELPFDYPTGRGALAYDLYDATPGQGGNLLLSWSGGTPPLVPAAALSKTLWVSAKLTHNGATISREYQAASVVGAVFTEDHSSLAIGNGITQLQASGRFAFRATSFTADIVADAAVPSGKALRWGLRSSSSTQQFYYKPTADVLAGATFETLENLYLMRSPAVLDDWRGGFRPGIGGVSGAGLSFYSNQRNHTMPGQAINHFTGSFMGYEEAGRSFWYRERFRGAEHAIKVWFTDEAEPTDWQSVRLHTEPLLTVGPEFAIAASGSKTRTVPVFSCGINTPAPTPNGFSIIPPVPADPFAYEAPSAKTSFSMLDVTVNVDNGSGGAVQVGRHADGHFFIHNPAGGPGVRIVSTSPASTVAQETDGVTPYSAVHHGMMRDWGKTFAVQGAGNQNLLNHKQGWTTTRGGQYQADYDPTYNVDPGATGQAIVLAPGEEGTFYKAVTRPRATRTEKTSQYVEKTIVFTVVATLPAANAIRPGMAAPAKVSPGVRTNLDLTWLRNLNVTAGSPSTIGLLNNLRFKQFSSETADFPEMASVTPRVNEPDSYSATGVARQPVLATLISHCNIDPADKERLMMAVCQIGVDTAEWVKRGGFWRRTNGAGGLIQGHKFPILAAGKMLNRQEYLDIVSNAASNRTFGEDIIFDYITQAVIDAPDTQSTHIQEDLGMPEWTGGDLRALNNDLDRIDRDATPGRSYRWMNSSWMVGAALAIHLSGWRATWNHQASLDHADRVASRTIYRNSGPVGYVWQVPDSHSPPPTFYKTMWEAYRTLPGLAPVWNWS